jgi:general secretion pathway protein H
MGRGNKDVGDQSEQGFTLLETLIVLAVAGLALIATIPAIRGPSAETNLRLHTVRIVAALKAARAQALAKGFDVAFAFDEQANAWRIEGGEPSSALPKDLVLKLEAARVVSNKQQDVRLVFFPDGSATGGRLTLATTQRALTIAVSWLDGAVAVVEDRP